MHFLANAPGLSVMKRLRITRSYLTPRQAILNVASVALFCKGSTVACGTRIPAVLSLHTFSLPSPWRLAFISSHAWDAAKTIFVYACALIFHCIPSQLILSPSVLPLPIPKDCSCEWRRVMSPLLTHKFTYKSKKGEESARFSVYVLSCEGHSACLPLSPSDYERLCVRGESILGSALACEEENSRVLKGP